MSRHHLLVTDADNTLWETDAIYALAQLDLLKAVEAEYSFECADSNRLAFIRTLTNPLQVDIRTGCDIPPGLSCRRSYLLEAEWRVGELVEDALLHERRDAQIEHIENEFLRFVSSEVPALRPGVATALPRLAQYHIQVVVLTEGELLRCERLLALHGLIGHLRAVVSEKKTVEAYTTLRRRYEVQRFARTSDGGRPTRPRY